MSLWAFSPQKVTVLVAFYENELTILVRVLKSASQVFSCFLGLTRALAVFFFVFFFNQAGGGNVTVEPAFSDIWAAIHGRLADMLICFHGFALPF